MLIVVGDEVSKSLLSPTNSHIQEEFPTSREDIMAHEAYIRKTVCILDRELIKQTKKENGRIDILWFLLDKFCIRLPSFIFFFEFVDCCS
jgi:hypothetical protein